MNRKNIFYYERQLSEPRLHSYLTDYPEKKYQVNKINQVKIMVQTFSPLTIDNSPHQCKEDNF
jgi:hypothetical protein